MTWKRTISFVLAIALVFSCTLNAAVAVKSADEDEVSVQSDSTVTDTVLTTEQEVAADQTDEYAGKGNNIDEKYMGYDGNQYTSYLNFLNYFSDYDIIADETAIDIKNSIISDKNTQIQTVTDDNGVSKEAAVINEDGFIDLSVNVDKAGLYHISLDYLPIKNKPIDMEIALTIDGAVQYKEINSTLLNRIWVDDKTTDDDGNWPKRDLNGNEVSPETVEVLNWTNYTIHDNAFASDSDLLLYFSEGEHSIKIRVLRESLALAGLTIGGQKTYKSYSDVYADYSSKGYKPVEKGTNITIHAEYPVRKSQRSLIMGAEYTASTTNGTGDNLHYAKTRFNVFGGESWNNPNEWADYEVEVDKPGLYTFSFKYKQDYVNGMNVYREIYVDGEIPYKELASVKFVPTSIWTNYTAADDNGNPYYVYLDKGKHTIRLNVTFGPIADKLQVLETQASNLNKWYMKIVQITGPSPDTLRDYDLDKTITGLMDGFAEIRQNLKECSDALQKINGTSDGVSSFVDVVIKQLDGFIKDPATIAGALAGYKSNIAEMSDIIVDMKNQSLLLDSFFIGDHKSLPDPRLNFTQSIEFSVKSFISSFSSDYVGFKDAKSIGVGGEDSYVCEPITVWMGGGIEQYNIMTSFVADKFVSKYKVPVKLILGGTDLTKAILAGIAPDIVLSMGSDAPVNYAMRGALVDLTRFNDKNAVYDTTFDEAYKWFHKSAFISLHYQDGGVYGLPTDQGFSVMFVRSDILNDLNIEVPQTWDDIYKILGLLQRNNMQIGLGSGDQGMLGTLLFQNGGNWFVDDLSKTNFDSDVFVNSFIQWTEFNTKWGIPLSYDGLNRFRTGEMPILFSGYGFVNTLQISTPELQGLWEMHMLPGTLRTDSEGNEYIDRTQQTGGSCITMINDNEKSDYAWQFMTWWAGADAQAEFNIKNETILVAGARGSPANLEAFERLPWTYQQSQVIKQQWEWLYDQNRIPGDYYIGRQLMMAYRAVVYEGRNPREALLNYNQDANVEIQRKRTEYNVNRYWEPGYTHVGPDGKPIKSIIDNETYERPTNYFNLNSD